MKLTHTLLAGSAALVLAGSAAGMAAAASSTPALPANSTEISGGVVWHEAVGHDAQPANIGILLDVNGSDLLVNLPKGTPMYRRYWGASDPTELHDGDSLNVWGNYEPNHDNLVFVAQMTQDTSIQDAEAEATGKVLFKDDGFVMVEVTQKPNGSPIGSTLVAARSANLRVTLPGGLPGQWDDLRDGESVHVVGTYDSGSQAMYDTDHIDILAPASPTA